MPAGGFAGFNPNTEANAIAEVDNAISDLELEIAKVLDLVNTEICQATDDLAECVKAYKGSGYSFQPLTKEADDSELPCCDGTDPNESPGGGSDPAEPGGGVDPPEGEPVDPGGGGNPFIPCFDENGNQVVCPEEIASSDGPVDVGLPDGSSLTVPGFQAPALMANVQAQGLTVCPDDSCERPDGPIKDVCCPDEPPEDCRDCSEEPEAEPLDPPGPLCCPEAPSWLCFYNPESCERIILSTDEDLPGLPWVLIAKYGTESEARLWCSSGSEPVQCSPPDPCPEEFIERFSPCNEELIIALAGIADSSAENVDEAVRSIIDCLTGRRESLSGGGLWGSLTIDGTVGEIFKALESYVTDPLIKIGVSLLQKSGPSCAGAIAPSVVESIIGLLEQWASGTLVRFRQPFTYSANYHCPYLLPSRDDAINAWLRGDIDDERLIRWARFNGHCPEQTLIIARANRATQSVGDTVNMFRRGIIERSEYERRIKQIGFLDDDAPGEFLESSEYIPPPTDLIRFMVRDVVDRAVVDRFNLDADFTAKYNPPDNPSIKLAANKQGISDEVMRDYWRAHWALPGSQQAIDMLHKLQFSRDPETRVEIDDVETVLKANDVPDFWVKRIIAAANVVPTRVDTRRMYDIYQISEEQYSTLLQRQGYTPDDAGLIVEFAKKDRFIKLRNQRDVSQYRQGVIQEDTLRRRLTKLEVPEEDQTEVIAVIQEQREGVVRKQCVGALKTRYMQGEFTNDEAVQEVIATGTLPSRAEQIVAGWDCQRKARPKLETTTTVKQSLEFGIITVLQAHERLVNIGYTEASAVRTIEAWIATVTNKRGKEIAAQRDKLNRRLDAERTRLESEQRRLEREAEQPAKEAEREVREENRRADKLQAAVLKFIAKRDGTFEDIYREAVNKRDSVQISKLLARDAANQVVIDSLEQAARDDSVDWLELADEIADSR